MRLRYSVTAFVVVLSLFLTAAFASASWAWKYTHAPEFADTGQEVNVINYNSSKSYLKTGNAPKAELECTAMKPTTGGKGTISSSAPNEVTGLELEYTDCSGENASGTPCSGVTVTTKKLMGTLGQTTSGEDVGIFLQPEASGSRIFAEPNCGGTVKVETSSSAAGVIGEVEPVGVSETHGKTVFKCNMLENNFEPHEIEITSGESPLSKSGLKAFGDAGCINATDEVKFEASSMAVDNEVIK